MHVHVHVAPKSPLYPEEVVRMAAHVWGALCAKPWPWPCGVLPSPLLQTTLASVEEMLLPIAGSSRDLSAQGLACAAG